MNESGRISILLASCNSLLPIYICRLKVKTCYYFSLSSQLSVYKFDASFGKCHASQLPQGSVLVMLPNNYHYLSCMRDRYGIPRQVQDLIHSPTIVSYVRNLKPETNYSPIISTISNYRSFTLNTLQRKHTQKSGSSQR